MAKRDIVVVAGLRSPLAKMGGELSKVSAVDLASLVIAELLAQQSFPVEQLDHVIMGNVIQPADAPNIARVIALTSHIPQHIPAYTVHRNCASGMQAVTDAAQMIQAGKADVVLAGGVESMSHAPFLLHDKLRLALSDLQKARHIQGKIKALLKIVQAPWQPRIALMEGLTDPTVSMNMGQTAELLSREYDISRQQQDEFSLQSHQRAAAAWQSGWYEQEVMTLYAAPQFKGITGDQGIRAEQSMQALAKLSPAFDRPLGTVTAGNSSQLTDGATILLLSHKGKAEAEGWDILGYVHDWAWSGCDPKRMGLGPAYASEKLLLHHSLSMQDMDRVEINEAFAAQVLATLKVLEQSQVGAPDMSRLNIKGGAIAMGHPVGMTGARLILSTLRQLQEEQQNDLQSGLGLASLCIGGGQGGAVLLGVEPCQH
ncbi:MAG: thiolase family protein [Mariprofundaceae bacterium]|nr:thiolase family protein [Mariprofundaceae bacterium]